MDGGLDYVQEFYVPVGLALCVAAILFLVWRGRRTSEEDRRLIALEFNGSYLKLIRVTRNGIADIGAENTWRRYTIVTEELNGERRVRSVAIDNGKIVEIDSKSSRIRRRF